MQLGAVLQLGDFIFPLPPKDSLDFTMERSLGKLDFPGGPPIYQDMGMTEKTLDFNGSLIGEQALELNDAIESLWWSGQELVLKYGDIQKHVRIQRYAPRIRRSDRVDYSIHLLVCFPEDEILDISNVDGQSFISSAAATATPSSDDPEAIEKTLDRTYAVRAGDTLWGIAARSDVYGDGSKWEILAKGNGLSDEFSLQVGQQLKIPSASNSGASLVANTSMTQLALGATGRDELLKYSGEVGDVSA